MSILNFISSLLHGTRGAEAPDAPVDEEVRALFKARFLAFKLLLRANNKALEIMADMEAALRTSRVFGMSFVRANCTAVSVNVYKLVQCLQEIAPSRYGGLKDRFLSIQSDIDALLTRQREAGRGDRYTLAFTEIDKNDSDQTGSKMANLGEVMNTIKLPVPRGFVITAHAFRRFMEHGDLQAEIDRKLQAHEEDSIDALYRLSSEIQQLIIMSPVPDDLAQAIREAYESLGTAGGPPPRVSLRSSALGEDAAGASFAGQFRSVLNVDSEHLLDAYREVVASKYSLPAMSYRLNRGLMDEDIAMCVGCMRMLEARAGGVMYSRNPIDAHDDSISISSVWGLPKSVVDGAVPTDLFVVSRSPVAITMREVKRKEVKYLRDPGEGVRRLDTTDAERDAPSLTDEQVLSLTAMAMRLEEHYGSPQDIEWAVEESGKLYILQCRPLLQVGSQAQPNAESASSPVRTDDEPGVLAHGGVTASPGAASGPVFVAHRDIDALKFPRGAVLVTAQSLPRWASLLPRAAAVVTEQGSATGHLANVAREFEVPSLFGVEGATTLFHEGDLVTVDADDRKVLAGRDETRLHAAGESRRGGIMRGSPVYETLRAVSGRIIPLNLLDPSSPEFSPESCRTYHDITRFVHEKAVQEMFNFGSENNFAERSGKQLFYRVPMQWWVLNLDDGFTGEVRGKYVSLDKIASRPMLAIWDGMTAVQWAGPPAASGRGMLSVFVESGFNPDLVPESRSFSTKSFFMVSKEYCCLSTRVGYHFTTVEAHVGEDAVENYVSMRYAGGAADEERRTRRAAFIADILEERGFATDVKEDVLSARIENREAAYMLDRLKILGYLLIHTRQLDMIMGDQASVLMQGQKIRADLKTLVPADHTA